MDMQAVMQTYLAEARELLTEFEEAVLDLETSPDNPDSLGSAFRALHTLKGTSGMYGFDEISLVTHEVENLLDLARSGAMRFDSDALSLLLAIKDHIQTLLEHGCDPDQELKATTEQLKKRVCQLLPDNQAEPGPAGAELPPQAAHNGLVLVMYKPAANALLTGANPLSLVQELCELGDARAVFHAHAIPTLDQYDPEQVCCAWDIFISGVDTNQAQDVFVFCDEDEFSVCQLMPGKVRGEDLDKLEELLLANPGWSFEEKAAQCSGHLKSIDAARHKDAPKHEGKPPSGGSIRIDQNRLDELVSMVGELVILQSRLARLSGESDNPELRQVNEELNRLSGKMRDSALGLRMTPVGTLFGTFRRMVRDVSAELGKSVNFVCEGAETELDKNVIDSLKDPLLHILRNSVDHGIEPASVRREQGKPEEGTLLIKARHAGGEVVLTISDDGKGLDVDRIRAKAVARGLVPADAELRAQDCFDLIFEPGFSTSEVVSSISGRGVGMDVVKKSIESLRGSVSLDSKPGHGTCTTIRLPMTLAIIEGMVVQAGPETYVLPLQSVRACLERPSAQASGRVVDTIEYVQKLEPCINLRRLFAIPGPAREYERIVMVEQDGRFAGLAVDRVVGRQQTVIKPLDEYTKTLPWFLGSTISQNGMVALILDIAALTNLLGGRTTYANQQSP